MKYCTYCGNKLRENDKFCSKCGNVTKEYAIEQNNIKREENKEKLLLTVGTLLIIIASAIFAYATWNEMSGILKVLFLSIEALLFLSISLFSKRVNEKLPYKVLWFIGITFIPIILNLVAQEKLLGDYLSYNGNGINVYLAISFFITSILYYVSYKLLKSKIFIFMSNIFSYFMVIAALFALNLESVKGINLIFPILCLYNLVICVLNNHSKKIDEKKNTNAFISLVVFISSIYSISYISEFSKDYFITSVVSITNIISLMYMLYKTNYKFYSYLYMIMLYIVSDVALIYIFRNYFNVSMFVIVLVSILINLIINIKNNNALKNTSFILMLINIYSILIINSIIGYMTLFICYLLLFITLLFIIKLNDSKMQKVVSILLLPEIILHITKNIIMSFVNMDIAIILLITSIILFTVYVVFYEKKKDVYTRSIFEIFSYLTLISSSFAILINNVPVGAFILNEILWLYYFTFNSAVKRSKAITIPLLIVLIINFIMCSVKYSISIYYSLLFISIITSILDFIESKVNNKKSVYIYISLAACALASGFEFYNIQIIGVGLNIIAYVLSYYLLIKNHNTHFAVKFIYTLVGFGLIDSLFHYFIDNNPIATLLVFITYIIIIISMYLLEVDTDRKVLSYSIVPIIQFAELADVVDFMRPYTESIGIVLFIITVLIYFERVFKLSEKDRVVFELILLSLAHLFTLSDTLLINFVLSAFYIFYGFYKKRDEFILLGIIVLVFNLVFNIFEIADNITATYVLLVIGVIMLAYVFYVEAKKNNKK